MKKIYIKPCFEIEEMEASSICTVSSDPLITQGRYSDLGDGTNATVGLETDEVDGYSNGRDVDGNGNRAKGNIYLTYDNAW